MKVVITELVKYIKEDHQATRYANRKTKNVEQGKHLLLPQELQSDLNIIFEHDLLF
jgi:hypothetical protein